MPRTRSGALHGSVSTVETPDVMCSLETFVTVIFGCGRGLFFCFLSAASGVSVFGRKQNGVSHNIRQPVFQFWKSGLADGGHVGGGRSAHLSGHRKTDGAKPAAAHGLWRHPRQPASLRGHYPGGDRGAHHGAVPCGNEQRAVSAAALHRHWCHDRFRPPAGKALAHVLWGGGPVRHLFHPVRGRLRL